MKQKRRKLFKSKRGVLSYIESGNPNAQTMIMIPPGEGNALYFYKAIEKFKHVYHVISLDLPGTNDSTVIECDLDSIALHVSEFFEHKRITKPILFAESYGGAVVTQLLFHHLCKPKKIIFFVTGEFYESWQKRILQLLFLPAKHSRIIRWIYAHFIKTFVPYITYDLTKCTDQQRVLLRNRLYYLLKYTLPKFQTSIPTLFFRAIEEKVVDTHSYEKIARIFTNVDMVTVPGNHFNCYEIAIDKYYDKMLEFLKS